MDVRLYWVVYTDPPNCKEKNLVNNLNEVITKVKREKKELAIGMDHNLDLLRSADHKPTQQFLDSLLDLDMLPYN